MAIFTLTVSVALMIVSIPVMAIPGTVANYAVATFLIAWIAGFASVVQLGARGAR